VHSFKVPELTETLVCVPGGPLGAPLGGLHARAGGGLARERGRLATCACACPFPPLVGSAAPAQLPSNRVPVGPPGGAGTPVRRGRGGVPVNGAVGADEAPFRPVMPVGGLTQPIQGLNWKFLNKRGMFPLWAPPELTLVERSVREQRSAEHVVRLTRAVAIASGLPASMKFDEEVWRKALGPPRGMDPEYLLPLLEAVRARGISLDPAPYRALPEREVYSANHPSWHLGGEKALEAFQKALGKREYAVWEMGPERQLPWFVNGLGFIAYHSSPEGEAEYERQCVRYRLEARRACAAESLDASRGTIPRLRWVPRIAGLKFNKDFVKGRMILDGRLYNNRGDVWKFTMNSLMDFIEQLKPGDYMWKRDLSSAYRQWLSRIEDRISMGLHVDGVFYVDCALPFGNRLSPFQFTACLGRPVLWLATKFSKDGHCEGYLMAYVDDFIGSMPTFEGAVAQCKAFERACEVLDVPIAHDKDEGPSQRIGALGLIADTSGTQVIVECPPDKLAKIRAIAARTLGSRQITARSLKTLVGKIGYVAVAICGARVFSAELLRWLREVNQAGSDNQDLVTVPGWVHHDLRFWSVFVNDWNGRVAVPQPCGVPDGQCIASDASCSALERTLAISWFGVVFYFEGLPAAATGDIMWLEHYAHAVLGVWCAALFGDTRVSCVVSQATDNVASQSWFNKGRSIRERENGVGRFLGRILATVNTTLKSVRLSTDKNALADSGTRKALREGGAYHQAFQNFITNELPRSRPDWWPRDYRFPPSPQLARVSRGSVLWSAAEAVGATDDEQSQFSVEQMAGLLQGVRHELARFFA
jgi:hypothetical protein